MDEREKLLQENELLKADIARANIERERLREDVKYLSKLIQQMERYVSPMAREGMVAGWGTESLRSTYTRNPFAAHLDRVLEDERKRKRTEELLAELKAEIQPKDTDHA